MIKAAVVSNSALCLPLLHYLQHQNVETVFYLGLYDAGADISSVLAFCKTNSIAVEIEKKSTQLNGWLKVHNPDYCFVFCYKFLIDVAGLGEIRQKIFNIHPGKLPQYRGPSPVFWQLRNGENNIGLTIHFISSKYDAGEIVWSREIANEAHFSHGLVDVIFSNILVEGVHYIMQAGINKLVNEKTSQDEIKAVTYKKPALQDVLVNWQTMHANSIINLVKACNPWNKGAITMCNNMEVKIVDAEAFNIRTNVMPGTIVGTGDDGLKIACAGYSVVKVNFLVLNGIFVPARLAEKFGFASGQKFANP